MTATQGWWRFPGHFLIAAAIPNFISFFLHSIDLHPAYLVPISLIALLIVVIVTLVLEIGDVANGRHTLTKGLLDFISKVSGFTVGILTWLWWWY